MTERSILALRATSASTSRRPGTGSRCCRAWNCGSRAGETLAIVGASGSGKTTLLQILGGLDLPTRGSVLHRPASRSPISPRRRAATLRNRALGFVYQFHHLLPEFTALENVAMPLLVRRTPVAEARARGASGCCERVGLGAPARAPAVRSCRAASGSARPWRARWSRGRSWCWPTNRPATSTARNAARRARADAGAESRAGHQPGASSRTRRRSPRACSAC